MVYIKRIEIKNFKSFAKPTVINFSRGFNAIVGRNGSGKSNIIDALMFVLGVSKARLLRMRNLDEVVFRPNVKTCKYPPAKRAVVTLYLDNSDELIPINSQTVTLTREITIDKRSSYRINGKLVSKAALINLLEAINISLESFNIIPQHRINEIVTMNPMEVRALIEEIAGIVTYDKKKEMALAELSKVNENLRTLSTILREKEVQLKKLEKEKNDAIRYKELEKQKNLFKEAKLQKKLKILESEVSSIDAKIQELGNEKYKIENELALLTKKKENANSDISKIEQTLTTLRDELFRKQEEVSSTKSKLTELSTEKRFLENEYLQYKKEQKEKLSKIAILKQKNTMLSEEVQHIDNDLNMLTAQKREIEAKMKNIKEEINNINTKYKDILAELSEHDNKISQITNIVNDLTFDINQIKSKQTNFESLINELTSRKNELTTELEDLTEKSNKLKEDIKETTQKRNSILDKLDEIKQSLSTLDEKIDALESRRQSLLDKKRDIAAKKRALEELREQFLSRHKAVSAVLSLKNKPGFEGIIGNIHDIIQVPSEYSTAISASIGSKFDYIIVRDDTTAAKCINYLKKNKIGRVTFLPLNILRPRPSPPLPKDLEGVIGPAMDLIKIEQEYLSAVQFLLGNTLIVENIDVARKLHKVPWKKVTLDGDIVETSGVMRGGHVQHPQVIPLNDDKESLNMLNVEIDKLSETLADLTRNRISLSRTHENLLLELNKLESTKKYLEQQQNELESKKSIITEKLKQISDRITEYKETIESLNKKLINLNIELERYEETLNELKTKRNELQATISTTKLTELNTKMEQLRQERDQIIQQINSKEITKTKLIEQSIANKAEIARLEENLKLLDEKIEAIPNRLNELTSQINDTANALTLLLEEFNNIKSQIQILEDKYSQIKNLMNSFREKITKLNNKKSSYDIIVERLKGKRDNLIEQIKDLKKQIKIEDIPGDIINLEIHVIEQRINHITLQMQNLEPINYKAASQYQEILSEYEELLKQQQKFIEEKKGILEFMNKLEQERLNTYLKTLENINKNMREIFAKISPGGEAYLELETPENPLMGGLLIKAKPAGKEMMHTTMMSGGEKALTALSLVFALQKHTPSPFYIMDEIDAALDNANAARVAALLKEFAKDTQIILITLRDVTMAKADTLIGVTQRNGVSEVITLPMDMAALKKVLNLKEASSSNENKE